MKSKKLIGIVAVLAVIAVVFAGSAAAVVSDDNAIYKLTSDNDNQIVKVAELTAFVPVIHFDSANKAMLTNLDSNALGAIAYRYAMLNAMDTTDFRANLNKNAIGAIVVGLNNMDTNQYGSYYLADLSRYSDVNSAALNHLQSSNTANLNSNFLILPASAMLTNLGTNQYGSYYLADLSRFADVNSSALNTMDTNTNTANLNSNFLILPVSVANLNSLSTNQYGYFNLANLNRAADVNSFAVSVADLSRFALNSGNLAELNSFLSRLNADTNTNSATTTLRADFNTLKTNLNADTNTNKNLSEASGTTISLPYNRIMDMDIGADVVLDAAEIRIRG